MRLLIVSTVLIVGWWGFQKLGCMWQIRGRKLGAADTGNVEEPGYIERVTDN